MLVDDNRSLLDHLSLILEPNLSFKLHDQPEAALLELQSQFALLPFNAEFIQKCHAELDDENNVNININFKAIRDLVSNPHRFAYVTSLIIDYSMPKLTGLEFCNRILETSITKIMLTGEAGPMLAIDAFNKNIIDRFIIKSDPDMQLQLKKYITSAQWDFFIKQSEHIMAILKAQPDCALFEPAYQTLIKDYFVSHYPCEFYLLDQTGSFLFIDWKGKMSWVIIKSKQELNHYYEIALDYSKAYPLSNHFMKELKQRVKIPFFPSEQHHTLPVSSWGNYLHTANPLQGENKYYYAIIQDHEEYLGDIRVRNYFHYLKSPIFLM
jgi:CheY-like chemotaxis protein